MLPATLNEWYLRSKKIRVDLATGLVVVLCLVIVATICVFYANKSQNTRHETKQTRSETTIFGTTVTKTGEKEDTAFYYTPTDSSLLDKTQKSKHETTRPGTTTFEKPVTKIEETQDYGYIAYLHIETNESSIQLSCVGTLIRINFVLTAAHCVSNASTIHIYLGTKNILKSTPHTVDFESQIFIIHENYNEMGFDNDIALIQITKNDSLADNYLIDIASLPDLELYNPKNSSFVVLGWGSTNGLNDVLLVKNVTVTDEKTCVEFYASEEFIYEYLKIICTKDKIGPCHSDSGAPLIFLNHIQVGVLSAGDENCTPDKPVRYMNVGYYAPWIKSKIAKTEETNDKEDFPYRFVASINTASNSSNCVGTFIRRNFVLTAAHCVFGASTVEILLGTKNRWTQTPYTLNLESEKVIIHENYIDNGDDNDIALIQIKADDSLLDLNNLYINTVSLSSYPGLNWNQKNSFVVLGRRWENSIVYRNFNGKTLEKKVTVVNNNRCVEFYQRKYFKHEDSKIICTEDELGPCHFYSGGPLILNNVQVGVLSEREKNCKPYTPVKYMNVGYYAHWIENTITETENNGRFEKYVDSSSMIIMMIILIIIMIIIIIMTKNLATEPYIVIYDHDHYYDGKHF